MKVYVISDSPEYAIAATNSINRAGHVAIMSETSSEDIRDLLSDLKVNSASGFDMILMATRSAKDVAISANKITGINAIACKDPDDAQEAMEDTRANVILVDSMKVPRKTLSDIIEAMLSGAEKESKTTAPMPRQASPAPAQKAPPISAPGRMQQQAGHHWRKEQIRLKMPKLNLDGVKKKGVRKSLKDAFGIDE